MPDRKRAVIQEIGVGGVCVRPLRSMWHVVLECGHETMEGLVIHRNVCNP